jgi:hypothetical protein
MKDIFGTDPLSLFPAVKYTYTCDLCGEQNPASHLADDAPIHSILCQPCADEINKGKDLQSASDDGIIYA